LATLRRTMTQHQIASPAIMVIGDVVQGLLATQSTAVTDTALVRAYA